MSNPFKPGDFVVSLYEGTHIDRGGVYVVRGVRGALIIHPDNVGYSRERHHTLYRAALAGLDYHEANVQPSGHHPDGSGVQKHSAGGLYPYVLCYRDSKEAGRKYDVGIIGPGIEQVVWCKSYDTAVDVAILLKGQS